MRMLIGRAVCLAGAVALGGCTLAERIGAMGDDGARVPPPTLSELQANADWAEPNDARAAGAKRAPKRTPGKAAAVPRPKIKPELIDPKSLVGLDKDTIEKMLGTPQHITLAQPATVWAWERDGCRMRLFFYPDINAQKFRALTYEISADQPKKNPLLIETCASRIKWANAKTPRK